LYHLGLGPTGKKRGNREPRINSKRQERQRTTSTRTSSQGNPKAPLGSRPISPSPARENSKEPWVEDQKGHLSKFQLGTEFKRGKAPSSKEKVNQISQGESLHCTWNDKRTYDTKEANYLKRGRKEKTAVPQKKSDTPRTAGSQIIGEKEGQEGGIKKNPLSLLRTQLGEQKIQNSGTSGWETHCPHRSEKSSPM